MTDWTTFVRGHLHHAAEDPARENDIVEEVAQHLAQLEAELVGGGLEPDPARRRVIEELPEWQRLAREIRYADRARPSAPPPPPQRGNPFAALWRDVVHAARTLRKSPTYTAVALTVLALGIGCLVISAVGIYGVLAYLVAQRTGEIGVRIALGATPGGVAAMVVRRAGALIGVGLAIGTGVALYVSRFAKSFLFQLEPNDPCIFAAALAVLALAGLVASVVPARRAAAIDPIVALRRQ